MENKIKVGIIGAGFTGLSAGYFLVKKGYKVDIFESYSKPGGLASGFKEDNWSWILEDHYHHLFSNDDKVLGLAKDAGHKIEFHRPKTSALVGDRIYQLDSAISLLKFPGIPLIDRIRMGFTIAYLKKLAKWKDLEKHTAEVWLKKYMGVNSWKVIWEPLFKAKFNDYAHLIPASWFWARIVKRTAILGYPQSGFGAFAQNLTDKITEHGGKIFYNTKVSSIKKIDDKLDVKLVNDEKNEYDKVICTLSTKAFLNITKELPRDYISEYKDLTGIGALTLILSLKRKFFSDGTYWLSVNDDSYPFVSVVEHTNMIESKHYGNENILYVGNYLKNDNKLMDLPERELVKHYFPYLKKINSDLKISDIKRSWLVRSDFAQPIVTVNYSKKIPPIKTPIKGLFLANMQQVYPWDRGTNYAVELGIKVANLVNNH